MNRRRGLTRVELVVVAGLVAFILFSALQTRVWMINRRRRTGGTRTVRCMANLKQWGLVFLMYTEDNNGYFFGGESGDSGRWWMDATRHFWRSAPKILQCPNATKPHTQAGRRAFGAWKVDEDVGSYGLNGWACNPQQGETQLRGLLSAEYCWRNTNVEDADNVPLFLDAMWFEGWPRDTDAPPDIGNGFGGGPDQIPIEFSMSQINRFCVNRHKGYVNVLFMDWSVRKVGLKELWTLKWHRNYSIDGPWTKAGGVMPSGWPQWMRDFKDY